jgi:hypothetical protein
MGQLLPPERWDKCKFCGNTRKETQGYNNNPRCPRQGCPGQQVSGGDPLDKK